MPSMLDGQRSPIGSLAKLGEGVRANSDAKTQSGLGRGAGQSKKLVNAAWTQTFPAQGATLDLDFANDRGYVRGVGQGRSMDAVTFTRASNGTFVKPDGTLSQHSNQGALGKNLLTFPQDLDNGAWTKSSTTVIANATTAPNGTSTADAITSSVSSNAFHVTAQSSLTLDIFTDYTWSCYFKKKDYRWGIINAFDTDTGDVYSFFDLENGVTGTVGFGCTATIDDVGDGWYRCIVTRATTSDTGGLKIEFSNADNVLSFAATIGFGIFAWGAQVELGTTATEYFPTNINVPRFDWASTAVLNGNLIRSSQDFTFTNWLNGGSIYSVTSNTITSPDGSMTGSTIATISSGATRMVNQTGYFATEPICFSVYLKYGNNQWINIGNNNGGITAWFDVLTGVVGTVTAGCTSSIEPVGNDWYRCSITILAGYASANQIGIGIVTANSSTTNPTSANVYAWGSQLEIGSTPTTYKLTGAQSPSTTPLLANPTSNGLLIEEARTNRILWCRDATQSNWTKTNVTVAKTQTGIDGVANSASSLTASSANGTCIQTITLTSGSRTGSVYLKRITGTGNVQVTLDGTTYSTVDLSTSEWRRIVLSGTVTNPRVGIRIVTSGDAVAMDFGQVEDGIFVTTPILTTTASVTRSADVPTSSGSNFNNWCYSQKGTIFAESSILIPRIASGGVPHIVALQAGTNLGSYYGIDLWENSAKLRFQVLINGSPQFDIGNFGNDYVYGTSFKAALAVDIDNFAATSSTANNVVIDTGGSVPIPDRMILGQTRQIQNFNGYINRIIFFPTRLSDNKLRNLVT